jgi:hypothetical protein
MYFLSSHFSFSLCDKHSVVISKVHYESIIFSMLSPRTLAKGKHLEKLQGLGTFRRLSYTMDEHDQMVAAGVHSYNCLLLS